MKRSLPGFRLCFAVVAACLALIAGLGAQAQGTTPEIPRPTVPAVLFWPFDEATGTAVGDFSAINALGDAFGPNPGKILDAPVWQPSGGTVRGCLDLGSSTQGVRLLGYAGATKSLTVALWFKTSGSDFYLLDRTEQGSSGRGWSLRSDRPGSLTLRLGSTTNASEYTVDNAFPSGVWTHVAFSFEGPTRKQPTRARVTLSINGMIRVSVCDVKQSPNATEAELRVGSQAASPHPFHGQIDDFGIWSKGLDREDLLALADRHPPTDITIYPLVGQVGPTALRSNTFVLGAIDLDTEDMHDFALVSGAGDTDNARFAVEGDHLILIGDMPPPGTAYSVRLQVSDGTGNFVEKTIRIATPAVDNGGGGGGVIPPGPVGGGGTYVCPPQPHVTTPAVYPTTKFVREWAPAESPAGTALGTLLSFDAYWWRWYDLDFNHALESGEGGEDNALFQLDPIPGQANADRLTAKAALDFRGGKTYHIRVVTSLAGTTVSYATTLEIGELKVRLNEVVTANDWGQLDSDGEPSDWLEIINAGPYAVELGNWCLSNQPPRPALWRIPVGTVLEPGDHKVYFASGKGIATPDGTPSTAVRLGHTNFRLPNDECGYLSLSAPDGTTLIHDFRLLPKLPDDESYGYLADDPAHPAIIQTPTPGLVNPAYAVDSVAAPTFLPNGGFIAAQSTISIHSDVSGAVVRATFDGSEPTETSQEISGPLPAFTGVIRARAFPPEGSLAPASKIVSRTFIVPAAVGGQEVMDLAAGQSATSLDTAIAALPAVCLTANQPHLVRLVENMDETSDATYFEFYPAPGSEETSVREPMASRVSGQSRIGSTPKASIRLEIDSPGLEAGFFGPDRARLFRRLALRTPFQNSWLSGDETERLRSQETRDEFARRLHNRMGRLSPVGRFVHVFLNGTYWGVYNLTEVPGGIWQSTYLGCQDHDFDTLKDGVATDDESGRAQMDFNAIAQMLATLDFSDPASLVTIEQRVDLTDLIDYLILHAWLGNHSLEMWSGPQLYGHRQYYAGRSWLEGKPFRFFTWDAETTLESPTDLALDVTPQASALGRLAVSPVFRRQFADRVQRHLFGDGALAGNRPRELFQEVSAEVAAAIPAEAARWGAKASAERAYTAADWQHEQQRLLNTWFPARNAVALAQFTAAGLYSAVPVPTVTQDAQNPALLHISSAPDTTAYITSGESEPADPAAADGAPAATATAVIDGEIVLPPSAYGRRFVHVRVRDIATGQWSPLVAQTVYFGSQLPTPDSLLISEIMYRPPDDIKDLEFVEFHNISPRVIDLNGLTVSDAIRCIFGGTVLLEPGGYGVIVRSPATFIARYGTGPRILATFDGALADSGETIRLHHPLFTPSQDSAVPYNNSASWPQLADGYGHSLVRRTSNQQPAEEGAASWRDSSRAGGSPGAPDPAVVTLPRIVINEIRSSAPAFLELRNIGLTAADVSGWYLDDGDGGHRLTFPAGSIVPAGGHVALTDTGDLPLTEVVLTLHAVDASGAETGLADSAVVDAPREGQSLGRTPSSGDALVPLAVPTPGAENGPSPVPALVISEIMYDPPNVPTDTGETPGLRYIELTNRSADVIDLDGYSLRILSRWERTYPVRWAASPDRVEIPLPALSLAPGGKVVVTDHSQNDPVTQRPMPSETVYIFEPRGLLSTADKGRVSLLFRDATAPSTDALVESVIYSDDDPWPESANGGGRSLERVPLDSPASVASSWRASCELGGSPGRDRVAVYTDWRQFHFSPGELILAAYSAPLADPDHDGVPNLLEYAFGTDPRRSAALPFTDATVITSGLSSSATFHIRRRPRSIASADYGVEFSTDFTHWTDASSFLRVVDVRLDPDGLETATIICQPPATHTACRYWRLRASLLPMP